MRQSNVLLLGSFGLTLIDCGTRPNVKKQKEGESILDYYRRLFKVCSSAGFKDEKLDMLFRYNLLPCIRSEMPKGEMQLG